MKKIITNTNINKNGDFYIDIKDLEDIIDTNKVKYYSVEVSGEEDNKYIVISFYDKNKKLIEIIR